MKIERARYEDGELKLTSSDKEAIQVSFRFKPGEYDLVPRKEKRSLDANAYLWVLLDKLATAMNLPKTEIYKKEIKDVGGNSDMICIMKKAAESFKQVWSSRGIGWVTDEMPSKIKGCVNIICYYGSSVYDRATMARLIGNVVQDCRAVGVETLPDEDIVSLMRTWNEKPKQ